MTVRRIDVQGDTATAEIFYEDYYRVQTTSGAVPRRDADVHRLLLKKIDGQWKIAAACRPGVGSLALYGLGPQASGRCNSLL